MLRGASERCPLLLLTRGEGEKKHQHRLILNRLIVLGCPVQEADLGSYIDNRYPPSQPCAHGDCNV